MSWLYHYSEQVKTCLENMDCYFLSTRNTSKPLDLNYRSADFLKISQHPICMDDTILHGKPPGFIPCTNVRRSPAWSCTIPGIKAYYNYKIGYFDMGFSPQLHDQGQLLAYIRCGVYMEWEFNQSMVFL